MPDPNPQLLRTLQQEKIRLEKALVTCQDGAATLRDGIAVLADLYWASHQLESFPDLLEMLDRQHRMVLQAIGASDGSITVWDEQTGELVFRIVQGQVRETLTGYHMPADTGIAGWVFRERQPVMVEDVHQDWRFSLQVDEKFAFFTRSILCLPIIAQDQILGTVQFLNKRHERPFSQTDQVLASVLADLAGRVLSALPGHPDHPPADLGRAG